MPNVKISRDKLPDPENSEMDIYPDGDKSLPRIGVLKFEKLGSKFILDPGFLPYQSF
jgi:hypothetical protein